MRLPRFSIAAAMAGVILLAVDLAALRFVYTPTLSGPARSLILSVLPMVNALAIVGLRGWPRANGRRRAFSVGFFAAGLATMLAHVACHWMFPAAMARFYGVSDPFEDFVHDHPGSFGLTIDRTVYWTYLPLLSPFYCWPQFLVAGLGGWMVVRSNRSTRQPTSA
jgi:hypothetical protein